MDPIEEVFTAMRVQSALYSRLEAQAPWGIKFAKGKLSRFGLVVSGNCWLRVEGSNDVLPLTGGDCFMVNTHTSFHLLDSLQSPLLSCEAVFANHNHHENLYFGGDGTKTDIILGRFYFDEDRGAPLMSILPQVIHVPVSCVHANLLQATLQLINMETMDKKMGSQLVVQHLADILLIQAMRTYFMTHTPNTGWAAAWADPRLKKALQALHKNLAHNWQVASLAEIAGMSRSAFALHFKNIVGNSPIEYLTQWRLYRAKCLLQHPDLSLMQIATQVGYDTDNAFSRAFKRETGMTPKAFRQSNR